MNFSLKAFEAAVYARRHDEAGQQLLVLLAGLDQRFGQLGVTGKSAAHDEHVLLRLAQAIGCLFADPAFDPNDEAFRLMSLFHRWIAAIFGATPLGTADHVLQQFMENGVLKPQCAKKFALLWSLDSKLDADLEAMWKASPGLTATCALSQVSARSAISPRAHARRERLLEWLPERLAGLPLDAVPTRNLHNGWMHSAYAFTPKKHELKAVVNRLMRRRVLELGLKDEFAVPAGRARPVMVVLLDWFHTGHVVERTFSRLLRALRERFELHALVLAGDVDAAAEAHFDSCAVPMRQAAQLAGEGGPRPVQETNLADLAAIVRAKRPDVVFHVGVGMSLPGVYLANLRLAPVQVASHGHPCSTRCETIDYFLLEESYAGAAPRHSERLLTMPDEALALLPPPEPVAPRKDFAENRRKLGGLDIAVMCTPMKLNPVFLGACARILEGAPQPACLHVMVGFEMGVARRAIERRVHELIPDAIVHGQMGREETLATLAACDLHLTPFPVGNSNSLVDCLSQGLPGVCLEGIDVGERMAAVVTRRLGLPEWMVARSIEEYVATGLRLVQEKKTRRELRARLLELFRRENAAKQSLFSGRPELAAEILCSVVKQPLEERREAVAA